MENKLLSSIVHNREVYEEIKGELDLFNLSELAQCIFKEVDNYYNNDTEANECDKELLKENIKLNYPAHKKLLVSLVDGLTSCSIPNVTDYVRRIKIDRTGLQLASSLTSNNPSLDENVQLCTKYLEEISRVGEGIQEEVYYDDWANRASLSRLQSPSEIQLYPKALNDYVEGMACKQHHILLFGRTNVGKSALSITLAVGFILQGLKVVYIGNEDPELVMRERLQGCLIGKTRYEIRSNPDEADRLAQEKNIHNLGFYHLSPGSITDVERIVKRDQPDAIIVDQVRNLHVNKKADSNRVLQLELACQSIRNIAQKYNCLAVSITQAGNSAHNKTVLEMNDVDFSNTGMQAHADLIIGMGCNQDLESASTRMLSFPKNKLNGKHTSIPVKINVPLNRITGV